MNVYLSSQSLKVGTCAKPESNRATDQDLVSKSTDEVQEKHTGEKSGWVGFEINIMLIKF